MTEHPGKQYLEDIEGGLDSVTTGTWRIGTIMPESNHVVDFGNPPEAPFVEICKNKYLNAGICRDDDGSSEANAAHIARCSPDRMRAIIEYVGELKRERDKELVILP